jgi:hypothetical protein
MSELTERVLVVVVTIIVSVTIFLIDQVGNGKRKTQRKQPADEYCLCTNVVTVGTLKGGIWTEADNFVGALLPKQEASQ